MRLAEMTEDFLKRVGLSLLSHFVAHDAKDMPPPSDVRKILVVRQHDQLGDMLCVVPLLRALRERYPGVLITLVAGPVNSAIMRHHPYLHEVLEFPKGRLLRLVPFLRALRKEHFDLAVVPSTVSSSGTSGLLALCAGAGVRAGAGSIDGKKTDAAFCFNHAVDLDWRSSPHRHQTLRNLDILGPPPVDSIDLTTVVGFTGDELRTAEGELAAYRRQYSRIVGLHPGAGKPVNRWPARLFGALANRIHNELGAGIVISAGPMDGEVLDALLPHLKCPYLLLQNRPLRHIAAIISLLDLFVANDTGIMHVAAATPVPLLGLFGPTDSLQWAPKGEKNRIIQSTNGRMDGITEEEVFQQVAAILR